MYSRAYTDNSDGSTGNESLPKNYSGYAKAQNASLPRAAVPQEDVNEVIQSIAERENRGKKKHDDRILPLLLLMLSSGEEDGYSDELLLVAALVMGGFFS